MGRFNTRVTSVRFEDLVGLGMLVGPGPGDFTIGAANAENAERIRVLDRNQFDCHVLGDDLEQDFSITVQLRNEALTSATVARILDFVNKTGTFAAAQTVNGNPTVWSWRTIVTQTLAGVTATFTLPLCTGDHTFAEAKEGNTVVISGLNNGQIIRT